MSNKSSSAGCPGRPALPAAPSLEELGRGGRGGEEERGGSKLEKVGDRGREINRGGEKSGTEEGWVYACLGTCILIFLHVHMHE